MIADFILKKIFGDRNARRIKKLRPMLERVNELAESYKTLSDGQLQAKTQEFRERLTKG